MPRPDPHLLAQTAPDEATPVSAVAAALVPFPEDVATRYLANGSWSRHSLAESFRRAAQAWPGRTALICDGTEWTYAELDARADRRAAGFNALGLAPGSAVLLQVNNTAEAVVTWYALLKAGLVPVCTLSIHRRHELAEIGRQTAPVAHVVDADNPRFDLVQLALDMAAEAAGERLVLTEGGRQVEGTTPLAHVDTQVPVEQARTIVDAIQQSLRPVDVAVFQLSGGTTGIPKVIPRLHAEYWFNASEYARRLGWTETARVAYIGPVVHNAGIICGLHAPHSVGATAILGRPDLELVHDLLGAAGATDIVLGPFAYDVAIDPRLAAAPGLRRVLFSGKKVPLSHFAALRDRGIWSGQLFGMGEGLCLVTPLDAPEIARMTTVGTPLANEDEVRILEPGGEAQLGTDVIGELCARGPYTLRGYFNAPEHNVRAFTSDGFYRTGDLAAARVIDGVTYYTMEGRIKDMINRGGEKISAAEVELLLVSHPGVSEAALVAMPDQRLGERACAFLVPTGVEVSLQDIRAHLESLGVAKYKWPERLVWLDSLPRRSAVGKIDKETLRNRAQTLSPEPR